MKYFGVTWGTKAELEGSRLQSWYPPLPPSLSEGRRHFLQVKITSNYNSFCDLYFEFESSEYVLKIAKVFFLWCLQLPSQFPNKAVRALQWYCVGTVGTFNQKVEIKIWKFLYIDIYKLKITVQKCRNPGVSSKSLQEIDSDFKFSIILFQTFPIFEVWNGLLGRKSLYKEKNINYPILVHSNLIFSTS